MTSSTSEQKVSNTLAPEITEDVADSHVKGSTGCCEAVEKAMIADGIRYEPITEVIYKDGATWNLTNENLLAASARQKVMWMLLLESTADEDDSRTTELLAESVEMFSYNFTFVRELLNFFHPASND